jgi:uncharacterized protein (DUF2062 family)/SAM-dependent methyltransferase
VTIPRSARWARLFHRLRTEGDTPARQACAVGLGLFIGCTPFYGFHLSLAIVLGKLFRLNRFKVYVASHISNPFIAPFLYASEIQVGGWLRRGTWYLPSNWSSISWWHMAGDILLGATVIGGVLAVVAGVATYAVVNRRGVSPDVAALLEAAASRFIDHGVTAWEFAHGKLRNDPVYLEVLQSGALPRAGTIVDVGCGQGLMLSLIASARDAARHNRYPPQWPPPPQDVQLIGVELRKKVAALAARALAGEATIVETDITRTPVPPCDAVLVFDVLHLLGREDQDALLLSIYSTLKSGGTLVIREADPGGGWRFTAVKIGNRLTAWSQRIWRRTFHFRTTTEWRAALEELGFAVTAPVAAGSAPFANVIIYATKRSTPPFTHP